MTFDDITGDGRLWATRYEGAEDNSLYLLFDQWNDVMWLRSFFKANKSDLISYFKIEDINEAISDTIEDSEKLERQILDISPEADLDKIFRPLENLRSNDVLLGKEKARLKRYVRHQSWLRIYAIKLERGVYIITGGSIKLTQTMQERMHTTLELRKMEKVRQFLISKNIIDDLSFKDYLTEM